MRLIRHVTVAACLLFFLLSAGSSIRTPGLYYDEVLFVNAALGNVTGPFVVRSVMGVPVMLMHYIGALKSYIYYPIFRIFGVSPATIRWPVILISAATLLVTYALARRVMPPGYALGVLALAASDAGFIGLTKLDYGPIVLGAFLRVLAVVAFLDLVQRSRRFSGGVLVAATALGLFDKLLFVWFVNALIVAALVVFRRELLEGWRAHPRRFTSVAVALAGTVAFFSWFLIVPLLTDPGWNRFAMPFTERVIVLIRMAKRVMDGAAMAWILIDQETLRRSWTWIAVLVAGGAGLALVRHRRVGRPLAFFLVLLAITAIQLVLTQQARRVHHTFSLWPWHFFLIVLVLWGLQPDPGRGSWRHVVPAAVIALLVAGQLRSTASLVAAHRSEQGFAVQWDPAIYRLSGVLEREYRDAPLVVSTDWGLHTPLHALAAPSRRGRYRDTWRVFSGDDGSAPDIKQRWMERLIEPGTLALTYVEGRSTFAVTRREVFALATERNLAHRLLRTIANEAGVPLYEIHRFDRPAEGGRSASGETVP